MAAAWFALGVSALAMRVPRRRTQRQLDDGMTKMSFESLGLPEPLLKAVAGSGYESATEVQARSSRSYTTSPVRRSCSC